MSDPADKNNNGPGEDDLDIKDKLEQGLNQVLDPFQSFIKDKITSSILLLLCAGFAMILANSQHAAFYQSLIHTDIGVFAGDWLFEKTLQHWINDGLMALFFFVIGLEIKREFLVGELKNLKQSIVVIAAALGGMVFPALVYYSLNAGSAAVEGWGIPMATDTAFAIGVLALLRKHVPASLSAFLIALAIIDDIGAILIIALFYTKTLSVKYMVFAVCIIVFLFLCNLFGIRRPLIYLSAGLVAWLVTIKSGIHASVVGIMIAMTVPARPSVEKSWFLDQTRRLVKKFYEREKKRPEGENILADEKQHETVELLSKRAKQATTPLRRWERQLEQPVVLFVLPVFALANTGISLDIESGITMLTEHVSLGIMAGLILGKGIGITLFGWAAVQSGIGMLPRGMRVRHLPGIALLGGIGFTMSTFIATLGFERNPELLLAAKTGIFAGSLLSGIAGYVWLRFFCKN